MLLLDKEYLVAGDILIMDSARIHGVDATWDLVFGLLNTKGVQLIYLPKYSPEFNPVELFWRYLKTKIRNLPRTEDFLQIQNHVMDITSSVPIDTIFTWYIEAITKWQY